MEKYRVSKKKGNAFLLISRLPEYLEYTTDDTESTYWQALLYEQARRLQKKEKKTSVKNLTKAAEVIDR